MTLGATRQVIKTTLLTWHTNFNATLNAIRVGHHLNTGEITRIVLWNNCLCRWSEMQKMW